MSIHYFIGYDPRDDLAAKVCVRSLMAHTKADVRVHLLKDHELRRAGVYWRGYRVLPNGQRIDDGDAKPFSTDFSFSRFCTVELARGLGVHEPVLFTDADFLWRADIADLMSLWSDECAVMCVQHTHTPKAAYKFDGIQQTRYFRKNWSSLMILHPDRTETINRHTVNYWPGSVLHAMTWTEDTKIGSLPAGWNHLVGYDSANPDAQLVHFTSGTPDVPGHACDEHSAEWMSYVAHGEMPEDFGIDNTGVLPLPGVSEA